MGNLTESPNPSLSLVSLNDDCLWKLFEYLNFEDSLNLAETCTHLRAIADRTFKKNSTIQLDIDRMATKEKRRILRFCSLFGHHVLSLQIVNSWGPLNWRIIKYCNNLKRLEIFRQVAVQVVSSSYTVENLRVLRLIDCSSVFTESFLNYVRKLKTLNIHCAIGNNILTTVFQNNPEIESFIWSHEQRFDLKLLEMISHVEKLSLHWKFENISELDPLLKLSRLAKLQLWIFGESISSFLNELAKKGVIQELELWNAEADKDFFEILTLFVGLKLLVLAGPSGRFQLTSSIVWPPQLKLLRLINYTFSCDAFISTIKQLKYLEGIDIYLCFVPERDNDNFNDVTKVSKRILHVLNNSDRKQRLDVILPLKKKCKEYSPKKKFLINSENLRILNGANGKLNPLRIRIDDDI